VLVWTGSAVSAPSDPLMTSTNYAVNESEVGGNGCTNGASAYQCGTSTNYSLDPFTDDGGSSLGESAVGTSSSTNYSSGSGFDTTAQPGLMMIVSSTPTDLGVLSTGSANTATSTFSVRNYTSYGYVVQIVGSTPSTSGHNLAAMTTAMCGDAWGCASAAGSEQFGLNLVANTSPSNPVVGSANPACQAAGFCSGVAGNGIGTYGLNGVGGTPYTVNGRYRYVSGETVASGPSSSGETDYTITYLANQSLTTPSGHYSGNLDVVATGTY
jgi:hypothetical protein